MRGSKIWGSYCPETDSVLPSKKLILSARTLNGSVMFWTHVPGCYITIVSFIHDATESYYERGKHSLCISTILSFPSLC